MTCTPTRATVAAAAAAAAAPEPHRAEFDQRYDAHLRHLRLKGLRPKTIEAYARGVRRMGEYFDHRIDALSSDQLSRYFSDLLDSHSWSSVKLDLYGYKFYTEHVLGRPWVSPKLVKAPKVQRLPDILTVEEAARLFAATRCLSYRVFFFTLYSMGLRLGEGLALRLGDIDAARMRVHVRDAKGRRDCLVPLPAASLAVLRRFWAGAFGLRGCGGDRRTAVPMGQEPPRRRREHQERRRPDHELVHQHSQQHTDPDRRTDQRRARDLASPQPHDERRRPPCTPAARAVQL